MSTPPDVMDTVRSVATHGLGRPSIYGWPDEPLDPSDWQQLLLQIQAQRLEGFLAWAADDGFLVTTEQAAELAEAHAAVLAANLQLERLLLEVTGTLTTAGVDS